MIVYSVTLVEEYRIGTPEVRGTGAVPFWYGVQPVTVCRFGGKQTLASPSAVLADN